MAREILEENVMAGADEGTQGAGAVGSQGQASSRRMGFLKANVLDFVLVLVVSVALIMTASFGFNSAPDYRGNPLLAAALSAPMLLILFAGSWSRRVVLPSAVVAIAYAVVVMVGAIVLTTGSGTELFVDGSVNDVATNYIVYACVALVVPVLAFLLSRRTVGLAFLLIAAVLCCCWIQFLYRDWANNHGLAISLVVYVGIAMLFVYQTYKSSVRNAQRAKKTRFLGVFAYAAGIALVCAGLGAAVFFGIVQPSGLQTADVRPFQKTFSVPVQKYSGVYSPEQVEDPDKTTDKTNDNWKDSNENNDGGDEADDSDDPQANPLSAVQQFVSSFSSDDWSQQFDAINYDQLKWGALIAALVIAAAWAFVIWLRRHQRARRLQAIEAQEPQKQVWSLYNFVIDRFKRMKVERPTTLTPMEFALSSQRNLAQFAEDTGGVSFVRMTDIYQRVCFGGQTPTTQELDDMKNYYNAFFKNAYLYSGKLKWIYRFWRI